MLKKVEDFIGIHNMIKKGDRIVAGVSGGADSVCLLSILNMLAGSKGAELVAAHVNHGIRGEEALRDERFVKELCKSWGIALYNYSFDVRKLAKEEGLSEEEAGRKVRYQAFFEVSKLCQCNKIAIAHNKNDNAETYLFNLFRGTGIKGLTGIAPVRTMVCDAVEITVIRPLLCLERREIEEYLSREGIGYCIDSTNLTQDYTRNKIRSKILNFAAEEINSQAVANISEAADKLKEALDYINQSVTLRYISMVRQEGALYRVSVQELSKEPAVIQKGIIRKMMEELAGNLKDLEAKHVEAVLSLCGKQVGKMISLPYGMIAEREYEDITLYDKAEEDQFDLPAAKLSPIMIEVPGITMLPGFGKTLETEVFSYKKNMQIPKNNCIKWFDYDKIENAVYIRNRNEGDYICINAAGGNKKLKSYFIDQKIPQKLRDSRLLITDGSEIMWIPGEGDRMSEKYKIDEDTKNVLSIKLINLEDDYDDR